MFSPSRLRSIPQRSSADSWLGGRSAFRSSLGALPQLWPRASWMSRSSRVSNILRNPIYSVVDRLAIASDGPVYSVILAHRGSIEQLREVVVDPASETSVNLLRCLLGELRRNDVEFVRRGEIRAHRGLLLIGDQAIRFRQQSRDDQIFDLGAEWKQATAKPFVYALWLIHPDYGEKAAIADALRSLGKKNLENLDALIAAQPESQRAFCEFYFRECLRFGFGEEEKKGFQLFGELCAKHKLLPAVPPAPKLV